MAAKAIITKSQTIRDFAVLHEGLPRRIGGAEKWERSFSKVAKKFEYTLPPVSCSTRMSVLLNIALSSNTNTEVLDVLSQHPNLYVREHVASNTSATERLLERLAYDRFLDVRKAVASNIKSHPDTLSDLSKPGTHVGIKRSVAANTSANEETLYMLSNYHDLTVRCNVASNRSTPSWLLYRMAEESDIIGMDHNNHNTKGMAKVLRRIASNVNAPEDLLLQFAYNITNAEILSQVALNPSTTYAILEILSVSKYEYVRYDVATNINTSDKLLSILAKDPVDSVKLAVALNPNASVETLCAIHSEDKDILHMVNLKISNILALRGSGNNENPVKGIQQYAMS